METGPTLLWIGCGSCSGESMAMLGVEGQATDDTSMVGEGITPSAANPEPCMIVSDHTAPQCMVNCD
jgi:hypothetical protein